MTISIKTGKIDDETVRRKIMTAVRRSRVTEKVREGLEGSALREVARIGLRVRAEEIAMSLTEELNINETEKKEALEEAIRHCWQNNERLINQPIMREIMGDEDSEVMVEVKKAERRISEVRKRMERVVTIERVETLRDRIVDEMKEKIMVREEGERKKIEGSINRYADLVVSFYEMPFLCFIRNFRISVRS